MRHDSNNAEDRAAQRAYILSLGGQRLARQLGGDRLPPDKFGREGASVPGPGHSAKDRSLEVRIDPAQPDGLWVMTYSPRDTWETCKDHVLGVLGFPPWQPSGMGAARRPTARAQAEPQAEEPPANVNRKRTVPQWLWDKSKPVPGSPVEIYLASVRGGLKATDTVRCLPADPPKYPHPAMIVPIGISFIEPEPGRLVMPTATVVGVHLTYLLPDGSGKADVEPVRRRIGHDTLGNPIPIAPMNDTLGLAITEGVEDGLTVYSAGRLGVWVAGGASFMPALADSVSDYTSCVTVFMHPEPSAIEFAARLVQRLLQRGIFAELQSTIGLQPLQARAAG
jgi:hypothetical protein